MGRGLIQIYLEMSLGRKLGWVGLGSMVCLIFVYVYTFLVLSSSNVSLKKHSLTFKPKVLESTNSSQTMTLLAPSGKTIILNKKTLNTCDIDAHRHDKLERLEKLPRIEWWDESVSQIEMPLPPSGFPVKYIPSTELNNLIFHPVPVRPLVNFIQSDEVPIFLTEKEKRKLNRKKRLEKERQKQDMIRMGLAKPPEPKLKLSNMFRILKDEAVSDPTALEAKVRKQVAARLEKHEAENLERHEAAQEGRTKRSADKWIKKTSDTPLKTAIFRFQNNSLGQKIAKCKPLLLRIEKNAQQMHIRGRAILFDDERSPSFIIVHGSFKAIKKYTHLLLKRIKWKDLLRNNDFNEDSDEESDDSDSENVSSGIIELLWMGDEARGPFENFRIMIGSAPEDILQEFSKRNAEHYYHQVLNN